MIKKITFLLIVLISYLHAGNDLHFYISKKSDKLIDHYFLDTKTGKLRLVSQLKLKAGPGGLTLSPDKQHIYFSLSSDGPSELGTAKILANGDLKFIGSQVMQSGGSGTISKDGKFYIKYNYSQNTISVLEMQKNLHTGKQIQEIKTTKNPHDIGVSNDGTMIFVPHNQHNRIYQFKLNEQTGKLSSMSPPYLKGPKFEKKGYAAFRSLAFHPDRNVVYCTYERGGGIASLKYDSSGLKIWQEFSTTEKGQKVLPTVVTLTPDKKFLYVPNRHGKKDGSSIAAFKLDSQTGKILHRIGIYNYSATGPRGIAIDKTGKFLFTSSVKTGTTFQFHINNNGSLKLIQELKIGCGSMLILELND